MGSAFVRAALIVLFRRLPSAHRFGHALAVVFHGKPAPAIAIEQDRRGLAIAAVDAAKIRAMLRACDDAWLVVPRAVPPPSLPSLRLGTCMTVALSASGVLSRLHPILRWASMVPAIAAIVLDRYPIRGVDVLAVKRRRERPWEKNRTSPRFPRKNGSARN